MNVLVGTSGYSYKEWKGPFYPEDLKNDEMLRYYAERLPTVEINNTFYRMPRERVILNWADATPERFQFVLKASRRITHMGRLKNVASELRYFLQASSALGDKRGPSLFQLPPNMKADPALLGEFLSLLPPDWRAAFEFRHPSWFVDEVYDLLRVRGAALVLAETDDQEAPDVVTADWGYVRLRRTEYSDRDLERWAERVATYPWDEAFVFLKHEDKGLGPKYAEQLLAAIEA